MRKFIAWALLVAGIVLLDAANDYYRTEVVAGILFLMAFLVKTGGDE